MIDDAFAFECVAHVFNFEAKNAFGPRGEMFSNHLYAFHNALTPDDQPKLPPEEFLRQWVAGRRLSGQRPVLHDPLRNQGRRHPLHAWQRGELVVL
jgi:hypothetical protein